MLNQYRPIYLPPLNVLIQINISKENNKNGIYSEEQCYELADCIMSMPNLYLRGIMALPSVIKNTTEKNIDYQKINNIFYKLKKKYNSVDTLSLGTSFDIEESLIAHSNMIRIGYAIFKD